MARGWESKSVEEQQSEFRQSAKGGKRMVSKEEAERAQRVERLRLARANAVSQIERSQNERLREMLQREIEYLDSEIAKLTRP